MMREMADRLRELHQGPAILRLPNAWDVASARLIEELGFPAVATSSVAVANTLGHGDGERITRDEMLDMMGRIARAIRVPLSADLEAGYARTPREMEETTRRMIGAGVAGLNLEDSREENDLIALDLQVRKIQALKITAEAEGVPVVLNARTDALIAPGMERRAAFAEAVRRGREYRDAGADCIFPLGLRDPLEIAEFLRECPGPISILAGPGAPSAGELEALGVSRVSMGSGVHRAAMGMAVAAAAELLAHGTYGTITEWAVPVARMNALFERGKEE